MYQDILLYFIFLVVNLILCTGQATEPPFLNTPVSVIHEVPTNLTLRETAIDITGYACSKEFCNTSSRYSDNSCFACGKCHCDNDCIQYGDCCVDTLFNSEDTVIQPSEYISCHEKYLKDSGTKPSTIFMYALCPKEYVDGDIKMKCEQPSKYNIDEVTLVSIKNDTYRNKYCAMCHGHDIYTSWTRTVECQSSDVLQSANDKTELWKIVLEDSRCKITPITPEGTTLRDCEPVVKLIDKCNISKSWSDPKSEQLCGMYYHPVRTFYGNRWYKNIFCAICNGVELVDICLPDSSSVDPLDPVGIGYPLSVLIDFNPKPRPVFSVPVMMDAEPVSRVQCNGTSIFDPFSENCRKAMCSFGRILSEGNCDGTLVSSSALGYSGSVSLTYPITLPPSTWTAILKSYLKQLEESLQLYRPFIFPRITDGTVIKTEIDPTTGVFQQTVTRARLDFQFVSSKSENLLKLEEDLSTAHRLDVTFVYGGKNHTLTTQPLLCQDEPGYDIEKGEDIRMLNRYTPLFLLCGDKCNNGELVYTPVFSILDCPFLEFELSTFNYSLNPNNISLEYDNQTFHLDSYEYNVCGDVLKICSSSLSIIEDTLSLQYLTERLLNKSNMTESPINRVSVSPALAIVSIVCIVLSLVCLFLTFSVYCLLPNLRTLPGKNTMVLVVYLFCAQLLFQVGNRLNYDQNVCQAMGVLIHYLWIATFTSMGVCAFHMHNVFTKLSRTTFSNKTEESKKVAIYLLIINLVPTVIVGICMAYHAGLSRGMEIGYGGDICFLILPMDIGIFFAAPLGIIIIFNIFCFVRVVIAIRNVPDMNTTKNKENRNHLKVYFRLSVLLGFAWIFGFIAAAAQYEPLWYVFIVLNGLQGVFIFAAYCVNRRTLVMIRDTCCCKQSGKYKSCNQTGSPLQSTVTSNL